MSRPACRLLLDAEGPGLERVLGALRFRQAELASLSVSREGDVLLVRLEAEPRPGRTLPDLEALFSRIGEVRSVETEVVDDASKT